MIPPSSSDSDFNGDGLGGNGFGGNGHSGNGSTATGLLIPSRTTLPADQITDWGDGPSTWNAAPQQQQGLNLVEFLRGLQRRWMLALGVAGGMAFLVMAAVFLFLPTPEESTAYLRVSPTKPSYLDGAKGGRSVSPDEVQRNQQNQQAFCKSEDVLRAVVREPKVLETKIMQENKGRQVDFLKEELQVGFVPRSDIMYVRLKGDSKTELATVVNEVVNQFLIQGVQKERADLRKKTVDLREVVRTKQQELDTARKRAKEKAETVGASTAANARVNNEILLGELMKLRKQQSEAEAMHSNAVTLFQLASAELSEFKRRGVTETMIDAALATDPVYGEMKTRAMQLEQAYRAQAPRASQQTSSVRQLAQGYQDAQRQINDYRRQASQRVRKGFEEQMDSNIRLKRAEIEVHARTAIRKKEEADKMMEEVKKKTQSTEDLAADEDLILRLVEFVNQKSAIIGDWDLELRAPDRVEIMQQATSPEISSSMFKVMAALGAGLLTGCVGLCAVGGWEYFKRRLSSVEDVSNQLGLNLVGTVPALPARSGAQVARGISAEQFDSILADSIDSVRATLIHGSPSGGNRTVMITSAWDGEGKTTVASQLAASLARCGRRTLLVDADFRNPTLHELFDLPNDRGLCEVLRGEVEPHKAIRETPAANLWLLSAGDFCHRSIQALENDAFGMLFRELKSEYDFVIVDTAPVLVVADPMLIGQHVDGAIVSTRLGYSQRPKIEEAVKRLRAVGVAVYGAVVNGTKPVRSRRAGERPALTSTGA